MAFDPDAYLEKIGKGQEKSGFDPDAYLAKTKVAPDWKEQALDTTKEFFTGKNYDWSNAPKDLLQGQVDALPAYAGAAGSVVGLGNPAVTGAFAAAGDSLKNGLNSAVDSLKKGTFIDDNLRLPTAGQVSQITNKAANSFNDGATAEVGGKVLAAAPGAVWRGAKSMANKTGQAFKNAAEKLAENATGATGAQSAKFSDDAGRQLLDRKLVKFGDNASNIANRINKSMDAANGEIDDVLKTLDENGVNISSGNVVTNIQSKIAELSRNPSKAGVVQKLEKIVEDIYQSSTLESNVPISIGEETKRGFNKMAGNWMDQEAGEAGKTAYQAYRKEVEQTANKVAPELAKKFEEAKKTYGLLAPIEEAATKRANTLNQSPFGGLLDTVAAGVGGGAVGGPIGVPVGIAAAVGRKIITPRISSSGAVTFNKISKKLMNSPQVKEFATKSPDIFQAMVYQFEKAIKSEAPMSMAAENQDRQPANKGPDKWMNDGIEKLMEHDKSIDEPIVKELMKTQKGKDLLIRASDLKPRTPAMEKIIEQIKSNPEYAPKKQIEIKDEPIIKEELPKEIPLKKQETWPKKVTRGGLYAIVKNSKEFAEAQKEGWR